MCFDATASFAGGIVVTGLAVTTVRLVRDRRELWFASLPLIFGIHQILEGIIWRQVDQSTELSVRSPAVEAWLFIAWFLLPIWLPLSVRAFEPDQRKRTWMTALAVLGAITGTFLYLSSMAYATDVIVNGHHLEYRLPFHPGWPMGIPYVTATCLPLLLSSRRFVNRFGVAMVLSMGVSVAIAAKEFSSVWCFFAALLSISLLVHYLLERHTQPMPMIAAN